MNKWILFFCCFSPFLVFSDTASEKDELIGVEQEIKLLKKRLQDLRLEEIHKEVEGQGLMIDDWDAYAKEIEVIRGQEEEQKQIEIKIKELEERKALQIKSPNHKS